MVRLVRSVLGANVSEFSAANTTENNKNKQHRDLRRSPEKREFSFGPLVEGVFSTFNIFSRPRLNKKYNPLRDKLLILIIKRVEWRLCWSFGARAPFRSRFSIFSLKYGFNIQRILFLVESWSFSVIYFKWMFMSAIIIRYREIYIFFVSCSENLTRNLFFLWTFKNNISLYFKRSYQKIQQYIHIYCIIFGWIYEINPLDEKKSFSAYIIIYWYFIELVLNIM